jgi:hypothetical protein
MSTHCDGRDAGRQRPKKAAPLSPGHLSSGMTGRACPHVVSLVPPDHPLTPKTVSVVELCRRIGVSDGQRVDSPH